MHGATRPRAAAPRLVAGAQLGERSIGGALAGPAQARVHLEQPVEDLHDGVVLAASLQAVARAVARVGQRACELARALMVLRRTARVYIVSDPLVLKPLSLHE